MTAAVARVSVVARAPRSLAEAAATLDREAQTLPAKQILIRALEAFSGRIAVVSSFGAESAALLHLLASIDKETPVLFLDTEKHFVQTNAYREELTHRLGLKDVRAILPDAGELAAIDPKGDLWRRDNDACCSLRKVRPLDKALSNFDAWITGRKRMHGNLRAFLPIVEFADPHAKINPLARWSAQEIADYMTVHDLPPHPLVETGFSSIGCWPCTAPTAPGDDARAGRWRGLQKTECGIHRI
jgi:phosphoadenosine phosphosulfate reductase